MSQTRIKTRIQQKHDIELNWLKATNFVPYAGELIVYDAETKEAFDAAYATLSKVQKQKLGRTEPIKYARTKLGDGITNVNDLPFHTTQGDWNQLDETKADFIKNKPFYDHISDEAPAAVVFETGFESVTGVETPDGFVQSILPIVFEQDQAAFFKPGRYIALPIEATSIEEYQAEEKT